MKSSVFLTVRCRWPPSTAARLGQPMRKPAAPKPDPAKGEAIATHVCAACHTVDGSRGSPANPILQGQHPEYLAKQLTEFKSGKRSNADHEGHRRDASSEDDMQERVRVLRRPRRPSRASRGTRTPSTLGEKIYRGGIADRKVPACAGCHSPNGAGIPAAVPAPRRPARRLHRGAAAWPSGRASAPTAWPMTAIAAKLSDREIKAVSDYIAGLR